MTGEHASGRAGSQTPPASSEVSPGDLLRDAVIAALAVAQRLPPRVVNPARLAVTAAQVLDCALRAVSVNSRDTAVHMPPRVSAFASRTTKSAGSTFRASRRQVATRVHTVADRALSYVEQNVLARILNDLTPSLIEAAMPEVIDSVLPRLVDAALPWVRTTAVPAIIGDLTTDSRISAMLARQSRSATAAAGAELRGAAEAADERAEAALRRRFRRNAAR